MNNSDGTSATTCVTKRSDLINTGTWIPSNQGDVLGNVNLVTNSVDKVEGVEPSADCFYCELCELSLMAPVGDLGHDDAMCSYNYGVLSNNVYIPDLHGDGWRTGMAHTTLDRQVKVTGAGLNSGSLGKWVQPAGLNNYLTVSNLQGG